MKDRQPAPPLTGLALYQGLWGLWRRKAYSWALLRQDASAALIVTLLLIPQSLAYAALAGLPLQTGLYASILPAIAYALLGTSGMLAVGPVAITSLLTFSALSPLAQPGSDEYLTLAILLASLSGVCLLAMGFLRMGFLAHFLSHPVMSAFVSSAALIIVLGQLKGLSGIAVESGTLVALLCSLFRQLDQLHWLTFGLGVGFVLLLALSRWGLVRALVSLGFKTHQASLISKMAPVVLLVLACVLVATLRLDQQGVAIVGALPLNLPRLVLPDGDWGLVLTLIPAAMIISLIGFAESIAIARTFAARRRQQVNSNRELMGLGLANLASGLSGAFPVTGGLSRTAINQDAGAVTPLAGLLTGLGMALALVWITGWLYYLPIAFLAAVVFVAVMSLFDWRQLPYLWRYSRGDAWTWVVTFLGVLFIGLEIGLVLGVVMSLGVWLAKNSRPHVAVVGRVPGTEHFRNFQRYQVETHPNILTLRIDESLMFANAQEVEQRILAEVGRRPEVQHLILMGSGINHIDASGVEMLEQLNQLMQEQGICLHFSELKGPVLDRLQYSRLLDQMTGEVHLTQHQAMQALSTSA